MQNRFGLKDFVLLVLVVGVGVLVYLSMAQNDHNFQQTKTLINTVNSVQTSISSLDTRIETLASGRNDRAASADLSRLTDEIAKLSASQAQMAEALTRLSASMESAKSSSAASEAQMQKQIAELREQAKQREQTIREQLASSSSGSAAGHDESWAHPGGVPIEWQPKWSFAHDPRKDPGYRVGGEFVEIFNAQPSKLTPILGEDVYSRRVQNQVLDSLADFDAETLKLRGVLAEAWQYDPKGYWLRVKLRDDVTFSDGVPITADDVVWTFDDYINNPQLETESLRSIMSQVDKYTKISDKVVEVTFKQPGAFNLATVLTLPVLPKHFYEKFTPKQINEATGLLMGSGPYKIKDLDPDNQWVPGRNIVLVRNEQYWGPKPAMDRMRFFTISDETAALTAYTNGEGDMVTPSSPQYVDRSSEKGWDEKNYSLKWVNMKSGYSFIGWQCGPRNGKLTPFHDRRVRLAMTYALDRAKMIRDIWSGIGEVATGPNNRTSPAYDKSVKPWPYDPAEARKLLAEAGWVDRDNDNILENERGDEFEFEFTISSGGQISERIAKYVKDQCAAVGIRCKIRMVDWAMYDQILKTRDFDAIIMGWASGAPESDPKQIWHSDSIENQGHNFIQWRNPKADPLVDGIRDTLDFDKRMDLWHQFHDLLHEQQPYTFLRDSPWIRFISKEFENVHPYPKGLEQREFYIGQSYNGAM